MDDSDSKRTRQSTRKPHATLGRLEDAHDAAKEALTVLLDEPIIEGESASMLRSQIENMKVAYIEYDAKYSVYVSRLSHVESVAEVNESKGFAKNLRTKTQAHISMLNRLKTYLASSEVSNIPDWGTLTAALTTSRHTTTSEMRRLEVSVSLEIENAKEAMQQEIDQLEMKRSQNEMEMAAAELSHQHQQKLLSMNMKRLEKQQQKDALRA